MKIIPLTRGYSCKVDDADYNELSKHKWCVVIAGRGYPYAVRVIGGRNRYMHRIIMSPGAGKCVDHKNHDTLDNQRQNLRICSYAENGANHKRYAGKHSSQFEGVHWDKSKKRWCAMITIDRKQKRLGYFRDETRAAERYRETRAALNPLS